MMKKSIMFLLLSIIMFCSVPLIWILKVIPITSKIQVMFKSVKWDLFNKKETLKFVFYSLKGLFISLGIMQLIHLIGGFCLGKGLSLLNSNLQMKAFEKIQKLPISFFKIRSEGEIAQTIASYSAGFIYFIFLSAMYIIPSAVSLIFITISVSIKQSIFFISWGVLFALCSFLPVKSLILSNNKYILSKITNISTLFDIYKNIFFEKTMMAGKATRNMFLATLEKESKQMFQVQNVNGFNKFFLGNVSVICFALFILFSIFLKKSSFALEDYLLGWNFHQQIWLIVVSTLPLIEFWTQMKERKKEIFFTEEEKNGKIKVKTIDKIVISNFSYSYNDQPLFKNINFTFNTNCVNIIKGASGSGKSTLIACILGLLSVSKGSIFIENIDIADIEKESLLQQVAFLYQHNVIFNITVRQNIELVNFNEENLDAIYSELDILDILDQPCGPGAKKISGGQQQRVSIARLMVRINHFKDRKGVIVLDEPFIYLDKGRKETMIKLIKYWSKKHLVILIDHEQKVNEVFQEVPVNILYLQQN